MPHPDVWVIDGGKGGLDRRAGAFAEAGRDIDIFSSAKGVLGAKKGMSRSSSPTGGHGTSSRRSPGLIQPDARTEAHRFAIRGHPRKRAAKREGSALDDIEGIGPRKRAAAKKFGSVRGICHRRRRHQTRRGSCDELVERIYGVLHWSNCVARRSNDIGLPLC